MIPYVAPTTADLQRLKDSLSLTGNDMAELASVAGGQQWRKYTGGASPREINMHMLFFIASRLTLEPAQLKAVVEKMNDIGAEISCEDFHK